MKLYIDYVNKYDNTVKMIRDYAQANPLFDSYLKVSDLKSNQYLIPQQGQDDPDSKGRGLTDFLIMPVQRIPRYVMLLQQLIKYTPDNHPDYSAINTGLSKISEIAGYINSQKKDYDSKTRVAEIQNLFGPKVSWDFNVKYSQTDSAAHERRTQFHLRGNRLLSQPRV